MRFRSVTHCLHIRIFATTLVILFAFAVLGYSFWSQQQTYRLGIRDELQTFVGTLAHDQEMRVESTRHLLVALAHFNEVNVRSEGCPRLLNTLASSIPNTACSAWPSWTVR